MSDQAQLIGELRAIWHGILGQAVADTDDYFAIGGDSLTGMRMVGAADQRGIVLTIADLYENPTIATLAAHLAAKASPAPAAPRARRASRFPSATATDGGLPLTRAQEGSLWHARQDVRPGTSIAR